MPLLRRLPGAPLRPLASFKTYDECLWCPQDFLMFGLDGLTDWTRMASPTGPACARAWSSLRPRMCASSSACCLASLSAAAWNSGVSGLVNL